jgi:hypothetical protein
MERPQSLAVKKGKKANVYPVRLDIVDRHQTQLAALFKTQTSHKLLLVLGIVTGFI